MSYGPMVLCRECDLWYQIACEKVDLNIYEENKNDYMCLLCSNLNQERNTDICDDEIVRQEVDRQNVVKQESGRDGMRDESGQEQVREESGRDGMRNESGQKGVEQESGGGDDMRDESGQDEVELEIGRGGIRDASVDKENDVYFGKNADIIPTSGILRYKDIQKSIGVSSGLALQLQSILKPMDRPLNANGRRTNWSGANLRLRHIKYGWYRIEQVYWC